MSRTAGSKNEGPHEYFGKWIRPTEDELEAMGMRKRPALPKVVKVCRPQHYGSRACMWVTEWVDERTYEAYVQKYQGLETLADKRRKKHE